MINVAIAAQSKSKRLFGGNFRTVEAARLPVFELEQHFVFRNKITSVIPASKSMALIRIFQGLYYTFIYYFSCCLPKLPLCVSNHYQLYQQDQCKKLEKPSDSDLADALLMNIFSNLSYRDFLKCKCVSQRWYHILRKHHFTQNSVDQIQLLFDDGEVVFYPIDERKSPVRHQFVSFQMLQNIFSSFISKSLYIRGLIPNECVSLLKLLMNTQLCPQQLFFLRCNFSEQSIHLLKMFVKLNSNWIIDFGLEDCLPSYIFSDQLMDFFSGLISLRLWNSGNNSRFAITDQTLFQLCKNNPTCCFIETLELDACAISSKAVASVIKIWTETSKTDLTIKLCNCFPVSRLDVGCLLLEQGISLGMRKKTIFGKHTLTFICL